MSDPNKTPEITDRMKCLLREVWKYAFSPKELSFFSVEGIIGHDENPTSDLLQFFMSPNGGHDLGPLFLRAFFACPTIDRHDVRFEGVKVETRVKTNDRKFPDFFILGPDWLLVIEHKIKDEGLENPLWSYEDHAKRFCHPDHCNYAILSPDGRKSTDHPQWRPVSHKEYCNALKAELAKLVFDRPISKWQVFAREFILHLENLDTPAMTMTQDQKNFVETNLRQIGDLNKLAECYTQDILSQLSKQLKKEITGIQFDNFLVNHGHCYAYDNQGRFQLWFQTPAQEENNSDRQFLIKMELIGLTEGQLNRAAGLFARLGRKPSGAGLWIGQREFSMCADAVDNLCQLAKEVIALLGSEPSVSPEA